MKEYTRFKVCKWSYFVFLLLLPVFSGTCPTISNQCEQGWVSLGGVCYLMPNDNVKMNHRNATKFCEQRHARLPVFLNKNEYSAFRNIRNELYKSLRRQKLWLGIQYNSTTDVYSYKSLPSGQVCTIDNGRVVFDYHGGEITSQLPEICMIALTEFRPFFRRDRQILSGQNCLKVFPFACQKLLYCDDCVEETPTIGTTRYLTTILSSGSSKSIDGNNLTQFEQANSAQTEDGHTNCIIVAVSVQVAVLCLFFLVFIIYKRKKTNEIKQKEALYAQLSSKQPASTPRIFAIGSGANPMKSIAYPTNKTLRTSKKNSPTKSFKIRGDILSKKSKIEHSCATETATSKENSNYETIKGRETMKP